MAADGTVIKEGKKTVVRNVITEQVARQMREMMEKVVSEGGGKTAAIKGYRIAGKPVRRRSWQPAAVMLPVSTLLPS